MMEGMITELLVDGLMAAIAATGFAIISNPPRKAIYLSAVLAAIGHALRYFLVNHASTDIVTATVISSFTIGMITIFFAS